MYIAWGIVQNCFEVFLNYAASVFMANILAIFVSPKSPIKAYCVRRWTTSVEDGGIQENGQQRRPWWRKKGLPRNETVGKWMNLKIRFEISILKSKARVELMIYYLASCWVIILYYIVLYITRGITAQTLKFFWWQWSTVSKDLRDFNWVKILNRYVYLTCVMTKSLYFR